MPKKQSEAEIAAIAAAEASAAEVARLREALELQAAATATHQARLAAHLPTHRIANSELMVGIRNVSDLTVGLAPEFPGDPEITLHADLGTHDPASVAIVRYTLWRRMRTGSGNLGRHVKLGLIVRDDSVLGTDAGRAPDDRPEDIPREHAMNVVRDPVAWIDERSEAEIRAAVDAMTSEDSMRRLRRVIDQELRRLQDTYPDKGTPEAAKRAIRSLPAKYAWLDEYITSRLEAEESEAGPLKI